MAFWPLAVRRIKYISTDDGYIQTHTVSLSLISRLVCATIYGFNVLAFYLFRITDEMADFCTNGEMDEQ